MTRNLTWFTEYSHSFPGEFLKQSTRAKTSTSGPDGWTSDFEDRVDFGEESRGMVEKSPGSLERGSEEVYL
jgi:hypothetical protein